MSNQEVKHLLRKIDFPASVTEALHKIALLVCGRVPSIKSMDLAVDLMAEFVFCEIDYKQRRRCPPIQTPVQELQLVEVLIDFFHGMNGPEAAKNTMFLSLFSGNMAMARLSVLTKVVSVAVALPSTVVLRAAGVAMQQIGNNCELSCAICESIIRDYCDLSTSGAILREIPALVPPFAANLLTAMGEVYLQPQKRDILTPSTQLLRCVTEWVSGDANLCVAAQQASTPALPPGAIAMEATTPLAGLIRWCVLAPLYHTDTLAMDMYRRLHLAVLHSMVEAPSSVRAVAAQDLSVTVGALARAGQLTHCHSDGMLMGVERLAQAVQVALSSHCVYGNVDDLFDQLALLQASTCHNNRLLAIVIDGYKQNKTVCL